MKQHADRNAQFGNIAKLKQEYISAHMPVISIDTKKKELLGNFTVMVSPMLLNRSLLMITTSLALVTANLFCSWYLPKDLLRKMFFFGLAINCKDPPTL